ncbi:hypothetical protein Tco_0472213, partial [Tanacetum coccineum]
MASKRTARARPAPETTTTTTSVTNAQLQAMIDQGVTAVLAARDANRASDDSHTSGMGVRRTERVAREMETVFRISNCSMENQIKFSTCTLLAGALTWWNSHVRIVGQDVAYAMTWTDLRKNMTDKYCPRNKMKKLEVEMFLEESDKVERYVGGLPDMIQGSVVASKPKTMQEATEMASKLMDKKINTIAERQAENKRKFDDISKNNQSHPQLNKRQNTGRDYAVGNGDKRPYGGPKPLCPKCNYHHDGPCTPRCNNYKNIGHLARDCRRRPATANNNNNNNINNRNNNNNNNNRNNNNNNRRSQGANTNGITCYKAYAVGVAGQNPNNNVVTGTFLLNNHCASILFDTSADRSFVSTAFSTLIDIIPTILDHGYDVELADGRIIGVNT